MYVFHYVQDDGGTVQSALQCMYLVQYTLSVNEGLAQPSLTRLQCQMQIGSGRELHR